MAYRDPLGAALMMPSALSAHQFQVLGQQEFLMQLAAAAQQGRLGHPGLFMPPAFFQSAQIPLNQHFMPHLVAQTVRSFSMLSLRERRRRGLNAAADALGGRVMI